MSISGTLENKKKFKPPSKPKRKDLKTKRTIKKPETLFGTTDLVLLQDPSDQSRTLWHLSPPKKLWMKPLSISATREQLRPMKITRQVWMVSLLTMIAKCWLTTKSHSNTKATIDLFQQDYQILTEWIKLFLADHSQLKSKFFPWGFSRFPCLWCPKIGRYRWRRHGPWSRNRLSWWDRLYQNGNTVSFNVVFGVWYDLSAFGGFIQHQLCVEPSDIISRYISSSQVRFGLFYFECRVHLMG